ncbi:MAG: biotin--[acetyl-CoA-carboxylase] ligase, partial [Pyrinomonadaceae bacterium]
VVASEQTAGRGRLERQWISPKDAGLYFSIVLRPRIDPQALPLLTLMASLAVREALLESCHVKTDIKWPNDVLANGRKLCGILAETVDTTIGRAVIVGIGINLAKDSFPAELNEIATSVESVTGARPDSERVLEALTSAFAKRYAQLQSAGGRDAMVRDWSAASSYAEGKRVCVTNASQPLEGITRGLELDGALRVETAAGEIRIIRAGDVTVKKIDD